MAIDFPAANKAIQTPPAKKGWHFPATLEHLAEFIEAETIGEATAIYHKIKRPIAQTPMTDEASTPVQPQATAHSSIDKTV